MPGVLRPSTPPPDFDLDQAITSLGRFAHRSPSQLALAHYGVLDDPLAVLAEAEETLRKWASVAEEAWQRGADIAEALDDAFASDLVAVDALHRDKLETLNGVHSNAAGLKRWMQKREASSSQGPGGSLA